MNRKSIINDPAIGNKAEAYEAFDDIPTNPRLTNTIGDIIHRRFGRRDFLKGTLGVSAATALFGSAALTAPRQGIAAATDAAAAKLAAAEDDRYNFKELVSGNDTKHHIAEGYDADVLLRWGDPITADAPDFDPQNQTAAAQLKQFGYNNDYVGFIEIEPGRGLLCVNHEYTSEEVMFPKLGRQDTQDFAGMTKELVDIEMAAHGGSVVEIAKGDDGKWQLVRDSQFNRRITTLDTDMTFDGPAAGHARMQTAEDPDGMRVVGTVNNCAGGITPWGTYLMAEENFHGYFWTDNLDDEGNRKFNLDKEPHEVNRFGWIVEVDPSDPTSTPVKHTALGRFRHEGAETTVTPEGRVVVYSGDDNRFDYTYKFVSAGMVSDDKAANMRLLSEGTLYVARFNEDGSMEWLPLVHGEGPLTAENGFESQADVMIDTRLAADLLEPTPMDRPEDVQPRGDGIAFVLLTNNTKRTAEQLDAANPRAESSFGHIIEIKEDGGDHAATSGTWDMLVKCGDPSIVEVGSEWNPETSEHGWVGSPDNCAIDAAGRLWISTDQGKGWAKTGKSDGLYSLETEGALRGHSKLFFRCPVGGELCGPYFSTDNETLFLAVQHPATDGVKDFAGFERDSTFEDPATRWPDFDDAIPPRPSLLVVTKQGGGPIAS